MTDDKALLPCPFCGGFGIVQRNPGSYGYRSPTVWVTCENEPFENPHGKKWDDRKHRCFARTYPFEEERWEPGKGTFSVAERALSDAIAAWNRRAGKAEADARVKQLEAENADLKQSVIAFVGPWAAKYARLHGLPDGHLHPTHFDLLAKCGARMDEFTRALGDA